MVEFLHQNDGSAAGESGLPDLLAVLVYEPLSIR
jgi:hypothetical protein